MRKLCLLCLIFFFAACNKKDSLRQELEQFIGSEFWLPYDDLELIRTFGNRNVEILPNAQTIIVYRDSSSCSVCETSKIYLWDNLKERLNKQGISNINIVVVLSPKEKDCEKVITEVKNAGTKLPVFIDRENVISRLNATIPHNETLHTFLLNNENYVQLVGDFEANEKLQALLVQKLKTAE